MAKAPLPHQALPRMTVVVGSQMVGSRLQVQVAMAVVAEALPEGEVVAVATAPQKACLTFLGRQQGMRHMIIQPFGRRTSAIDIAI